MIPYCRYKSMFRFGVTCWHNESSAELFYQDINPIIMSTENLKQEEAAQKMREIIDKIDIGMLTTYPVSSHYIHAVPMSRQEVDEDGCVWFLFSAESDTFQHLQRDARISLLYADPQSYTFLSLNGQATVSNDPARIDKYWNKMTEGWFEKGREDPNIRVLQVTPQSAHYWDTKSNKLVTFLKAAANAITGSKADVGRQGDLEV